MDLYSRSCLIKKIIKKHTVVYMVTFSVRRHFRNIYESPLSESCNHKFLTMGNSSELRTSPFSGSCYHDKILFREWGKKDMGETVYNCYNIARMSCTPFINVTINKYKI